MTLSSLCLLLGGVASFLIVWLHLALALRSQWYRYFGADKLAQMHEQGSRFPMFVTLGLTSMFALWCAYGLSGAGVIGPLPLLRFVLIAIGAMYVLRSLMLPSELLRALLRGYPLRFVVFSTGSLVAGLFYLVGTLSQQSLLRRKACLG